MYNALLKVKIHMKGTHDPVGHYNSACVISLRVMPYTMITIIINIIIITQMGIRMVHGAMHTENSTDTHPTAPIQ